MDAEKIRFRNVVRELKFQQQKCVNESILIIEKIKSLQHSIDYFEEKLHLIKIKKPI